MKDVIAIVVTYNRKNMLSKCINSLLNQTYKPTILIIDNMSTDGTKEMLNNLILNKKIIYHSTGKNIGGAGGFYEGIKLAYKLHYRYFWLMDDDCIPTSDALKNLIDAKRKLNNNFGFLISKTLWKNNDICKMNIPKKNLIKKVNDFSRPIIKVRMGTFVSFFTKKSVVKKVGLPIKEFFIWGDDLEYSQRISSIFPSYLITESIVHHETVNNRGSNISSDDYKRIGRYRKAYRNEVVLFREMGFKGKIYQFLRLILHVERVLVKSKDHKKERLSAIFSGTREGLHFYPKIKKVN